jgi:hypothetical protein
MKRILVPVVAALLVLGAAPAASAIEGCGPQGCDPTTEPAKRADLRIGGAAVLAANGNHWNVSVTVTNGGVGAAGAFDVVVARGTTTIRTFHVTSLFPGKYASFSYQQPLVQDSRGRTCSISLTAKADPANDVLEFTDGNNVVPIEAQKPPCGLPEGTVEEICPGRFVVSPAGAIPVCSTRPLQLSDPTVTRAIVVVHGSGRDAPASFSKVRDSADDAGTTDALIIAPQFLTEGDVDGWGLASNVLFWGENGWKQGDGSLSTAAHPRPGSVSSFAAVDAILLRLTSRLAYPNLRTVIITGHSAGGQFTNRFAAGSPAEAWLRASGITTVRYAIANPSSYLYMTPLRPRPPFLCFDYNDYRYGLDDLNPYMANAGASTIKARYGERQVTYLLGADDDDPEAEGLDESCSANAQGANRLQRGESYFGFLDNVYGTGVYARHTKYLVPGVGHSSKDIYNSAAGRQALFG